MILYQFNERKKNNKKTMKLVFTGARSPEAPTVPLKKKKEVHLDKHSLKAIRKKNNVNVYLVQALEANTTC